MANYVDVEALIVGWLKTVAGFANVVTEAPTNLVFVMPLVVVERFGGTDQILTLDAAHVDIDVYAADRTSAKANAETIRRLIRTRLPGYRSGGAVIAKVETISAPSHAPYDSRATVRRFTAAYRVSAHQYAGI